MRIVVSRSFGSSIVRVAMMPGTAQAKLDSKRDEGAAGQADAVHQPVHQEGGADHVAGAFEQQDEEEQDQDLRQEDDDRADAGDGAVDDQRAQQPGRKRRWRTPDSHATAVLDPRYRQLAPGEHRLEHHEHDRGEDDRAERPGEAATASRRWVQRRTGVSLTTAAVAISRARRCRWTRSLFTCSCRPQLRRRQHVVERGVELRDAAAAHGDGLDHRHAELGPSSRVESSSSPSRLARSTMLSAMTIGSPSSISCSAKRR